MEQFPTISRLVDANGRLTTEGAAWIAALVEKLAELEARIAVLEGE